MLSLLRGSRTANEGGGLPPQVADREREHFLVDFQPVPGYYFGTYSVTDSLALLVALSRPALTRYPYLRCRFSCKLTRLSGPKNTRPHTKVLSVCLSQPASRVVFPRVTAGLDRPARGPDATPGRVSERYCSFIRTMPPDHDSSDKVQMRSGRAQLSSTDTSSSPATGPMLRREGGRRGAPSR